MAVKIPGHVHTHNIFSRTLPSGVFVPRVLANDVTMMGYNIPAEVLYVRRFRLVLMGPNSFYGVDYH